MVNDPRVAPPPAPDLQTLRNILSQPDGITAAEKSMIAAQFMQASRAARDEKSIALQQQIDRTIAAMRREQHAQAQNLAAQHQNDSVRVGFTGMGLVPSESVAPNVGRTISGQPFFGGFAHIEDIPPPSVLQASALAKMNPIARDKFEPLFQMMNIQVRFEVSPHWTSASMWRLTRVEPGKPVVSMSWSAPNTDPGCGLATWDAMVSELLDEITRANQLPSATGSSIAGQQVCSSAGNS
jgi:hypothetical protein